MLFRHSIPILLSTVFFNIPHLDTFFLLLFALFFPEFELNLDLSFKIVNHNTGGEI